MRPSNICRFRKASVYQPWLGAPNTSCCQTLSSVCPMLEPSRYTISFASSTYPSPRCSSYSSHLLRSTSMRIILVCEEILLRSKEISSGSAKTCLDSRGLQTYATLCPSKLLKRDCCKGNILKCRAALHRVVLCFAGFCCIVLRSSL